jgi:hypothetical protein
MNNRAFFIARRDAWQCVYFISYESEINLFSRRRSGDEFVISIFIRPSSLSRQALSLRL